MYYSWIHSDSSEVNWQFVDLSRLQFASDESEFVPDCTWTPMMRTYWGFDLHLCQEQLGGVGVSQFSSCFSWSDWFCESCTSYAGVNCACFWSWKHSPQHGIFWFCSVRAVKGKISIFDVYVPCEASSWALLHQGRKLSSRVSLQSQLFCLCRLPAVIIMEPE